jgi:NadR type nicotinamide-nucleotide adenylyltransferase
MEEKTVTNDSQLSRNGSGDKKLVKLALVGPECSGKTTLAKALSEEWNEPFVEEYAREYLESLGRNYNQDDILDIAKGQLEREYQVAEQCNHFLICDTNTLVSKVWAEVRFGRAQNWIERQFLEKPYQLYILCGHKGIEWEYDDLRENPDDRQELYDHYRKALIRAGKRYIELEGTTEERIQKIKKVLKRQRLLPREVAAQ